MKKILFIFLAVFMSALAMATSKSEQYGANNLYVTGIYNTSAYDGSYRLLDENGFPKKACVMGVQLNSLPEGYHYSWNIIKGNGDEVLQVQPGTDFAYIGQNGYTDELDFTISIIDESNGFPVTSRTIRFVFIDGFVKPMVPPIG